MKYYVVYDDTLYPERENFRISQVIAYHESKRVAHEYAKRLKQESPKMNIIVFPVKESLLTRNKKYYDYYLIRYGNNYIQSKFYDLISDDYETVMREIVFTKEILLKLLEHDDVTKSDRKSIEKTISFLTRKKEEIKDEIPSYQSLKFLEIEQESKSLASSRWGINPDDENLWKL